MTAEPTQTSNLSTPSTEAATRQREAVDKLLSRPASTSDGSIIIACLMQGLWGRLCNALGCPEWTDDPRYASGAARLANRAEVDAAAGSLGLVTVGA